MLPFGLAQFFLPAMFWGYRHTTLFYCNGFRFWNEKPLFFSSNYIFILCFCLYKIPLSKPMDRGDSCVTRHNSLYASNVHFCLLPSKTFIIHHSFQTFSMFCVLHFMTIAILNPSTKKLSESVVGDEFFVLYINIYTYIVQTLNSLCRCFARLLFSTIWSTLNWIHFDFHFSSSSVSWSMEMATYTRTFSLLSIEHCLT